MSVGTKTYFKNPFILVDGHDFSGYVKSVAIQMQKDQLDITASGDNAHAQIPGLSKDSIVINFYQDADLSIIDRVLYDVYAAETAVVVECCKSGSTVSEANPSYTLTGKLYDHSPFSGDVGTVVMATATFLADGPIVRAGT